MRYNFNLPNNMMPIRIIIADDHPIVLTGIREILTKAGTFQILSEVNDGKTLLQECEQKLPDLLLTDISLPGLNGLDVAERLKIKCVQTKIALISMHHEVSFIKRALQLEIAGFISKRESFAHLPDTLKKIHMGNSYFSPSLASLFGQVLSTQESTVFEYLTRKERELLQYMGNGKSATKELAHEMNISIATVRRHIQNIMNKLEIHKRWELIQFAKDHRLCV